MTARHSTLSFVLLRPDGSGFVVGIWPDGRPDLIEGTADELHGLLQDIASGRYAPQDIPNGIASPEPSVWLQ